MNEWRVLRGDVRERLAELPVGSARCCVTSPPYWGLRDYGVSGQLGLESTPEAYVAAMVSVFREVRRVLTDDGTLWLNLGDSYARQAGDDSTKATDGGIKTGRTGRSAELFKSGNNRPPEGLKPKDLVGIPWMVAKALRDPYYHGSIKDERDRIWLAAMLDAEGCMFIQKRKAGQNNGQGYQRQNDNYGPGVEIANTSRAVVDRIMELVGKGSICSQGPDETGGRRKQTIYRWNLRTTECRDFVRELYPYLVAKQQQARILIGCPSSGERAEAAHEALKSLHRTGESGVDFPAPESLFTPGWYLRSDIIWSKANPMPESVTDRPTKAHEYIFLLSKSRSYYYDAAAIREPYAASTLQEFRDGYEGHATKNYTGTGAQNASDVKRRIIESRARVTGRGLAKEGGEKYPAGVQPQRSNSGGFPALDGGANKRSVWNVATSPYPDAHFATFPEKLIEPCILAGSAFGDTVLDPFTGSGTTGAVAIRHQRNFIGCELNPAYVELARKRIGAVAPMFAEEVA